MKKIHSRIFVTLALSVCVLLGHTHFAQAQASTAAKAAAGSTAGAAPTSPTAPGTPSTISTANPYTYQPPLGNKSVTQIVGDVIKGILPIVGALFFFMFIYGGFLYMTAGGEAKNVTKGRDAIVAAVIGMLIVLFAYTLAYNVVSIFGFAVAK